MIQNVLPVFFCPGQVTCQYELTPFTISILDEWPMKNSILHRHHQNLLRLNNKTTTNLILYQRDRHPPRWSFWIRSDHSKKMVAMVQSQWTIATSYLGSQRQQGARRYLLVWSCTQSNGKIAWHILSSVIRALLAIANWDGQEQSTSTFSGYSSMFYLLALVISTCVFRLYPQNQYFFSY